MKISNLKTEITKLHYNKNAKGFFLDLLDFLSLFYEFAVDIRNSLYDSGKLKTTRVNAKVISVGNLTTGGVGKTPVVSKIAEYFANNDEKVAIISRGYGGQLSNKKVNLISDGINVYYDAHQAGDEAYWHAINTPSCAVITSKNRVKAAQYAIDELGATVIILDDGFQYRALHRDLNLVLVDSELRFGNKKILPAGPLREKHNVFDRIDKIIVVNKGSDIEKANRYAKVLEKEFKKPTLVCQTLPDYIYNIISEEKLAAGEPVNAVCAIGQPESFFKFVEQKHEIIKKYVYDDHHLYKKDELDSIKGTIVTTEKDAVKMLKFKRKNIYALKLKTDLDVTNLIT